MGAVCSECCTRGRCVQSTIALLAADGELLPAFVRHRSTPTSILAVVNLLIGAVTWILQRILLLLLGAFNWLTLPEQQRTSSVCKGFASTGLHLFRLAAVLLGVTIGSYHAEYLQPHGLDALLQFVWDGTRTSWTPRGGFADMPIPPRLPQLLEQPGRRPSLHHVTVANKVEENFYRLLRSAMWHGNEIDVLGRKAKDSHHRPSQGLPAKVQHLMDYTSDLPAEDVVLWTDAYDALMLGSHDDVLAGYAAVLAAHPPNTDPTGAARPVALVFAAEANSASDVYKAKEYPAEDRLHLFAYLNPGLIIGSAGGFVRMLHSSSSDNGPAVGNGQQWFTDLYLASLRNSSMPRIALDHQARMFFSTSLRDVEKDLVYSPAERTFHHAVTGTVPSVMHYPGWAGNKQNVQVWHLVQGANNMHCGLLMCFPWYSLRVCRVVVVAGIVLGLAWLRAMSSCKLGRAVLSVSEQWYYPS